MSGGRPGGVVAGNVYAKWQTRNPLVRLLMWRFERTVANLVADLDVETVLEVGCGEGELSARLLDWLPAARAVALDVDLPVLRAARARLETARAGVLLASADRLPFGDDSFDLVVLSEVLEHLPDPARAVAEAERVARRHVLLTVPAEPLWRVLNMLRGAYLGALGNTPGHVQHWSPPAFVRFLAERLDVRRVSHPLPWTAVLAEVRRR